VTLREIRRLKASLESQVASLTGAAWERHLPVEGWKQSIRELESQIVKRQRGKKREEESSTPPPEGE